jgi:hypothetical protein
MGVRLHKGKGITKGVGTPPLPLVEGAGYVKDQRCQTLDSPHNAC